MFRMLIVLFVALGFVACISVIQPTNQQEVSSRSPALRSTQIVSPTTQLLTTSIASLIASNQLVLTPVITASRIFPHSWSPDGSTLAYWTFTAAEVKEDFKLPPGVLHFLQVHTGKTCNFPYRVHYSYFGTRLFWLATGEIFLVTDDKQVVTGRPCDEKFSNLTQLFPASIDIIAAKPDHSQFILNSKQNYWLFTPQTQTIRPIVPSIPALGDIVSWSPTGNRVTFTNTRNQTNAALATTYVIDLAMDQVQATIHWEIPPGEGAVASPFWLNEHKFLIQATRQQGPLLVTLGQPPVQIASKLFGILPRRRQWAKAALVASTNTYHIAFSSPATEEEPYTYLPIRFYYSKTGKVAELPFQNMRAFSPDGKWLLSDQDNSTNVWLWPVDGLAGQGIQLLISGSSSSLIWKPDSSQIAVAGYGGVTLFAVPGGAQVSFVKIGDYNAEPFGWSPDGKFLAIRGSNYGQEGLFIWQTQSPQPK